MQANTANSDAAYLEAHRLREAGEFEAALGRYGECLAAPPPVGADKSVLKALIGSIHCANGLEDWTAMESFARRVCESFPASAAGWLYLGEALIRQTRAAEAVAPLRQSLTLAPDQTEARALLNVALKADRPVKAVRRVRSWPPQAHRFADLPHVMRRYLVNDLPGNLALRPDTVFMTLGSCFAENLARRLEESGHRVNHEPIGEEVNTTFANRYLLEWIEQGPVNAPTRQMDAFYGPQMHERLRAAVLDSDVFILTFGVAPCFFDDETGEVVFSWSQSSVGREFMVASHTMRTTTVTENALNIRRMIESIRRLSRKRAKIVLTVSPVPLSGTTEFDSAFIADCLSKSTLRLACQEALAAGHDDHLHYWPSFEIVRWAGTHLGPEYPPVYGHDDGNSRHVSSWMVNMIIDLFLERHGKAGKEAKLRRQAEKAAAQA